MKIKPIGERVLIKPIKSEQKTASGIYLPESEEKKKEGQVIEAGHDPQGRPLPLKAGDIILYGGYSTEEFEFDKEKYLIIDFKDILAKIE